MELNLLMKRGLSFIFGLTLLASFPAFAILNGQEARSGAFEAVAAVYVHDNATPDDDGYCSGTLIHPYFVITAASCMATCQSGNASGCVVSGDRKSLKGERWGNDGLHPWADKQPLVKFHTHQTSGSSVVIKEVEKVYFPKKTFDLLHDLAVLKLKTPMMTITPITLDFEDHSADPDLSRNYIRGKICREWKNSWPWAVGFGNNNQPTGSVGVRRAARLDTECELEREGTVFVLDGDRRTRPPGVGYKARSCNGADVGGGVFYQNGYGSFHHYGVIAQHKGNANSCPKGGEETLVTWVPAPFMNRIAQEDPVCRTDTWMECSDSVLPPFWRHSLEKSYGSF
jgi:hypothetical protein